MPGKRWLIWGACLGAVVLTGCTAGSNPMVGRGGAGFWSGLWHGMICPISFAISLFNASVSIYEVQNNGGWYNFGFILGAGAWGVLGGHRASRND